MKKVRNDEILAVLEAKENEAKDEVHFKLAPKGCIVSVLEEHRYYGKSNESIAEMIFDLLDKNGYTITEKFSCERASED